jgi:hypothetical protein
MIQIHEICFAFFQKQLDKFGLRKFAGFYPGPDSITLGFHLDMTPHVSAIPFRVLVQFDFS